MTVLRTALALAVAAALTALLVVGSGAPYVDRGDDGALIRLSWRAVGERVEECRQPTEAELAALPPHMRQREICEGRLAPFRLDVSIDGAPRFVGEIRPAGAREDRPTYVLHEFPVAPGAHRVRVRFATVRPDAAPGAAPPLTLDATVVVEARDIALVTLDDASGSLRLRSRAAPVR